MVTYKHVNKVIRKRCVKYQESGFKGYTSPNNSAYQTKNTNIAKQANKLNI